MEKLSNLSLTILEIISEQRNVHKMVIQGQIQEINQVTGKNVTDLEINEAINNLIQVKLVKQLSMPNTYTITEKGKDYV